MIGPSFWPDQFRSHIVLFRSSYTLDTEETVHTSWAFDQPLKTLLMFLARPFLPFYIIHFSWLFIKIIACSIYPTDQRPWPPKPSWLQVIVRCSGGWWPEERCSPRRFEGSGKKGISISFCPLLCTYPEWFVPDRSLKLCKVKTTKF